MFKVKNINKTKLEKKTQTMPNKTSENFEKMSIDFFKN